jgi:hypothetical protein
MLCQRAFDTLAPGVRRRSPFDAASGRLYAVQAMSSPASTKEIAARSPLSGRPVGLTNLLALNLLGLLLLLLAR